MRHALRISKMPHTRPWTTTTSPTSPPSFSYQPTLDPRKVKDLASLAFAEAKSNAALRSVWRCAR
ncbi:hypothetical protein ACWDA3_60870 [Nonomuraea rubra]